MARQERDVTEADTTVRLKAGETIKFLHKPSLESFFPSHKAINHNKNGAAERQPI